MSDETKSTGVGSSNSIEEPAISIALLIKNGLPALKDLLENLLKQQGCQPFEIVAVDSGSTDGSLDVMRQAGVRVTQIAPETFRFGATRQMLFGLTRGKIIVTLSQDVFPDGNNWLAGMTEPISQGNFDMMQAIEQPPAELQAQAKLFHFVSCYSHWETPYRELSCSGMAISRSAWEKTGFGTVPMSEDKFLGCKARELKMRVGFCYDPVLIHAHDYDIYGLAKRSFNEGLGGQYSNGAYSIVQLFQDLLNYRFYKQIISLSLKHHKLPFLKACTFTIRPVFLYLGYRFGQGYWR